MYYIMYRKHSNAAWSFSKNTYNLTEATGIVRRYRRTGYLAEYVPAMT